MTSSNKHKTAVCYNTLSPTWYKFSMQFEGTLRDTLSQVIVVSAYHINSSVLEPLGECKVCQLVIYILTSQVPVKSYYSVTGSSIPFVLPLNVQGAPFGEIRASLQLKNLPYCSQVEGGYRSDEGVIDAQPLIEECPRPKLPESMKYVLTPMCAHLIQNGSQSACIPSRKKG